MKQKIVIITSKYLHPFVEKAFEDFKEDCTVTIADYTNFDHITDIYRKYEKTADGFMISGTTAMAAIEHHIGEFQKPVISFHADLISFYHALVKLFLDRKRAVVDPQPAPYDPDLLCQCVCGVCQCGPVLAHGQRLPQRGTGMGALCPDRGGVLLGHHHDRHGGGQIGGGLQLLF